MKKEIEFDYDPEQFIQPQCSYCGSKNIIAHFTAEWNTDMCTWMLADNMEYMECLDCHKNSQSTQINQ